MRLKQRPASNGIIPCMSIRPNWLKVRVPPTTAPGVQAR